MSKFVPDPFAQVIQAALVGRSGFLDGGILVLQSAALVEASALISVSIAPPPAVPSIFSGTIVDGGTLGGLTATVVVQVQVMAEASASLVAVDELLTAAVFATESPVIGELAEVFAI